MRCVESCISPCSDARDADAGNLLGLFDDDGIARFTDLTTDLARNDVRFACRFANVILNPKR